MIASAQTLRRLQPIRDMVERTKYNGFTYGLGPAGYDIRIKEDIYLLGGEFKLASAMEYFQMPNNLLGVVHDKSTWARLGLCVQNTVIEPGWHGYLTIELTNHNQHMVEYELADVLYGSMRNVGSLDIKAGTPIAQVVFHLLDEPTELPYNGKYQNQREGIQPAILE